MSGAGSDNPQILPDDPSMEQDEGPDGPIDVPGALRNILAMLQNDPVRYKLFGVYWWAIKALLKRSYTSDNLFMLGDYQDATTAAMIPPMNLQDTMRAALVAQRFNAIYPRANGMVENPDGEVVQIWDADAES